MEDVGMHNLRQRFISVEVANKPSLRIIGALFGHTQAATTQLFAHLASDPLKETNDVIGSQISASMESFHKNNIYSIVNTGANKEHWITILRSRLYYFDRLILS